MPSGWQKKTDGVENNLGTFGDEQLRGEKNGMGLVQDAEWAKRKFAGSSGTAPSLHRQNVSSYLMNGVSLFNYISEDRQSPNLKLSVEI
ncbi:hypothetical protein X801_10178 [Opisthorchis viverrini]|uniref:Uncharacterized protein n=1 Tax=Opisthorchis viverrini TaxID=6198 RepID=A0A1S8WHW2_OPIVI|nr:hypothetical protein X801_10178 [Opisthorchis viverrini]